MPAPILIIEDHPEMQGFLSTLLRIEGFDPVVAGTGTEGMAALERRNPVLVILDLGLPDMDGRDLCRRIRSVSQVPLLMLTGRDSEMDKVLGLELGADDYVTKPFSRHELMARVRALLRRSMAAGEPQPGGTHLIQAGPLTMNQAEHRIWLSGKELALTHTEFAILSALMQRPGVVMTREVLLERIWGVRGLNLETRTVDNHVARLRKKLAAVEGGSGLIETVAGAGYRLADLSGNEPAGGAVRNVEGADRGG